MNKEYPSISIVIPTYNEESMIDGCLDSIKSQKYPKRKVEILIVDNNSTDMTLAIAKKYSAKVIFNNIEKDTQVSKRIGFENSKGEYWMWFDADMRMGNKNWLRKMIQPLEDDKSITASLASYKIKGDETSLTKFFTLDRFQRDPIYQFFSAQIESTYQSRKKGYILCRYETKSQPAQGLGVFRRKLLKKTVRHMGNKFMDLDNISHLTKMDYRHFALVENIYVHHYFMRDLNELIQKRLRNIKKNFTGQEFERAYMWVDFNDNTDRLKMAGWIIYANLFIPELVRGFYKSIRNKTLVGMYQPIVTLLETDIIVLGIMYYSFVFQRIRR